MLVEEREADRPVAPAGEEDLDRIGQVPPGQGVLPDKIGRGDRPAVLAAPLRVQRRQAVVERLSPP